MEIEQTAFVLHSRPYRETSALVTFFTPEYGKINGVVRGVRGSSKSSSQKSASIQPFQKLNLQWRDKAQSHSELVSIRQFESLPIRFPLQSEANICGLYMNELLYRLLFPQVATETLFDFYQQSLYELLIANDRKEQAWALRQFESQLLIEMGHALVTDVDIEQQPIDPVMDYYYYPQSGAILAVTDRVKNGILIKGECLLTMSNKDFCPDCLPSLKRLFRVLLSEYLGNKPIKTRELFQ